MEFRQPDSLPSFEGRGQPQSFYPDFASALASSLKPFETGAPIGSPIYGPQDSGVPWQRVSRGTSPLDLDRTSASEPRPVPPYVSVSSTERNQRQCLNSRNGERAGCLDPRFDESPPQMPASSPQLLQPDSIKGQPPVTFLRTLPATTTSTSTPRAKFRPVSKDARLAAQLRGRVGPGPSSRF